MNSQGKKKGKVFLGMSGGVDSSVSAALLKRDGYDVTGVFIQVWQPSWIECNWREERRDAMRVAAHLVIPFVTLDLEKEYKQGVIDYMIAEYKLGRTPNPDVMCNREVKFGAFSRWAKSQGADFVATGHYAQAVSTESEVRRNGPWFVMLKGNDMNKDQTYFLWTLTQADLKHTLFPIGHLPKSDVRKLAKKFGLPNAEKKDSQGLCFIGKLDVKEFLSHYITQKPGNVLNTEGKIIGRHDGALLITLGERHGFIISDKTPNDKPYYVVSKNVEANTITVSNNKSSCFAKASQDKQATNIKIYRNNWIRKVPKVGEIFSIRTRYRQTLFNAKLINIFDDSATFEVENAAEIATPGQSLVAYNGEECIGGGIIK